MSSLEMGKEKIAFAWFISAFCSIAQASDCDSLVVRSTRELNRQNVDEAKALADRALHLAKEADDRHCIALASYALANTFQASENYLGATDLYTFVIKEADILKDSFLLADALTRFGVMRMSMKQYPEAEANIQYGIKIANRLGDTRVLCTSHIHLGLTKYNQDQYNEALALFLMALKYATQLRDTLYMAASYQNIGATYEMLKDYGNAKEYTDKALELSIREKDQYYVNKCYKNLTFINLHQKQLLQALETQLSFYSTLKGTNLLVEQENIQHQVDIIHEMIALYHETLEKQQILEKELEDTRASSRSAYNIVSALSLLLLVVGGYTVVREIKLRRTEQVSQPTEEPIEKLSLKDHLKPLLEKDDKELMRTYLYRVTGWRVKDIAELMNISSSAISQRIITIQQLLNVESIAHPSYINRLPIMEIHELLQEYGKPRKE